MAEKNPTNISGAISAAASVTETKKEKTRTRAQLMNAVVSAEGSMKLLRQTLNENAGAFAASIIDLYNTDDTLAQCNPKAVFAEALKACSLKLPINKQLGFAYIIPYRDHGVMQPHFQIGYKGLIQLAMRSGVYRHLNAGVVYEGEFLGVDKLSGEVDISGDRTGDAVVGYFAFMETKNGFRKTLYWSSEEMKAHISRFSQSYQKGSSIWRENYDAMCIKTVLRNLLSKWGLLSVEMLGGEMEKALTEDNDGGFDTPRDTETAPEIETQAIEVDPETGEVIGQ